MNSLNSSSEMIVPESPDPNSVGVKLSKFTNGRNPYLYGKEIKKETIATVLQLSGLSPWLS